LALFALLLCGLIIELLIGSTPGFIHRLVVIKSWDFIRRISIWSANHPKMVVPFGVIQRLLGPRKSTRNKTKDIVSDYWEDVWSHCSSQQFDSTWSDEDIRVVMAGWFTIIQNGGTGTFRSCKTLIQRPIVGD